MFKYFVFLWLFFHEIYGTYYVAAYCCKMHFPKCAHIAVVKSALYYRKLASFELKVIKLFSLLTEYLLFHLTFYLFQSSNYISSVNYLCKKLFTLKGMILSYD